MILKRLRLENFFSYKEADIELGPHMFFVSGENRDETSASSNGAGKSLLCQSIVWCLFDDLIRSSSLVKDDVIGPNETYALVELDIEKDGQQIKIIRTRNHPTYKSGAQLWVNSERLTGHKDTDSKIEEVLGINSKTIYHCAYNDPHKQPLVNLTSAKMKEAVSEILGTERFDVYLKKISSMTSSANNELKLLDNSIQGIMGELENWQKALEHADDSIKSFESTRQQKIQDEQQMISKLEASIQEMQTKLVDRYKYDQKLMELQEKLTEWSALNAKYKETNKLVKESQETVSKYDKKLSGLQHEYKAILNKRANLENNPTGQCDYCGNLLSNSEHLVSKIKAVQVEADAKFAEIAKIEPKQLKESSRLEQLVAEEKNIQHQLQNFNELLEKKAKLETFLNALGQVEQRINVAENEIKTRTQSIESIKEQVPPFYAKQYAQEQIKTMSERLDEARQNRDVLNIRLQDLDVLKQCVSHLKVGVFNSFIKQLWLQIEDCLDDLTSGDFDVTLKTQKDELQFLFSSVSKGDKYFHYSIFSSGEQKRISKAVSTALEEILDIGFVIDDEACVFVDSAGIAKMLDFTVKRNQGKTLFFVGLTPELTDYFEGERNLHVIKENGISRVELRYV